MTATLRASRFATDPDFGPFDGYTDGATHNGWSLPYFTLEQAQIIAKKWAQDPYLDAWYDVDEDAFFFVSPDNPEADDDDDCEQPMVFHGETHDINGAPVTVYPLGHYSDEDAWWMWTEIA